MTASRRQPELPKSNLTMGRVSRFVARKVARRRPATPLPRLIRIECERLEMLVRAPDGRYVQPWLLVMLDLERKTVVAADAHVDEPTQEVVVDRLRRLARARIPREAKG